MTLTVCCLLLLRRVRRDSGIGMLWSEADHERKGMHAHAHLDNGGGVVDIVADVNGGGEPTAVRCTCAVSHTRYTSVSMRTHAHKQIRTHMHTLLHPSPFTHVVI
jgi:hypothetical protein